MGTEDERLRALFDGVELDGAPGDRDLVGPAVAWGRARRRLDRLTVAGSVGALAAVAVAGAVALGGGGPGGTPSGGAPTSAPGVSAVSPASACAAGAPRPAESEQPGGPSSGRPAAPITVPPTVTDDARRHALLVSLDTLRRQYTDCFTALLPQGYRFVGDGSLGRIVGPSGSSVILEVGRGGLDYAPGPDDTGAFHEHKATPAFPLVSGTVAVDGAVIQISSKDFETGHLGGGDTFLPGNEHTIIGAITQYSAHGEEIVLSELTGRAPWNPQAKHPVTEADAAQTWGRNDSGPILSPEQWVAVTADPWYGALAVFRQQITTLEGELGSVPASLPSP